MPPEVTIEDDRPETPPESRDVPVPGSEPDHFVPGPDLDADPAAEVPLVEVDEIAVAIKGVGETLHGLAGHPEVPEHWGFTDAEVAQLAPPVTSLINRHARARAIAQRSPELAVGLALSRWGIRNARLTAAIRKLAAEMAEAEADEADEAMAGDILE